MIPERIGGTVEANAKDKGRAHNGGEEDAVSSGKGVVKGAGQTHGVQAQAFFFLPFRCSINSLVFWCGLNMQVPTPFLRRLHFHPRFLPGDPPPWSSRIALRTPP